MFASRYYSQLLWTDAPAWSEDRSFPHEDPAPRVDLQPDRRGAGTLADHPAGAAQQVRPVDVPVGQGPEVREPGSRAERRVDRDALGLEPVGQVDVGADPLRGAHAGREQAQQEPGQEQEEERSADEST